MKVSLRKQKSCLLAKKADLERGIAALTEAYPAETSRPVTSEEPNELEDMTTVFLEHQNEQSIMVTEVALLSQVKSALQRLEDGTYGLCADCQRPVPPRRLEALPWAERCVACEARLERVYQAREEVYGEPQTF